MNESATSPLRLKEWLILQIDSGKYPGLRWENEEKTKFRIPWKHAAKHNYNEEEDAALFKAWAMHKGKFKEGSTKEDPSVWKTRLRCALNKSPDFQEVMENCQDFGEPYKLYRIVYEPQDKSQEGSKEAAKSLHKDEPPRIIMIKAKNQMKEIPLTHGSSEHLQLKHPVEGDYWLHVRLYYQGHLFTEVTTQTAEGCRIIPLSSSKHEHSLCSPNPLEDILLSPPQKVPGLMSREMQLVVNKLLLHLDKGVFLWVAPDGVYIKRQCQARVYWSGPLAPNTDHPNKLEREKTCKVLDTERFMQELQMYLTNKGPEPQYQIQLCFGEEYPGLPLSSKMILTAHVEPVFARELLINAKTNLRKNPPAH
ncbi:hypothetical protein GDO81_013553 [Engystomops pustulosus]|uniref:IRF tryptophan pentad repeat domain-containing protein n=1 Tax=Engystomops pustulosus TaxID=76066 RepID=A0AAV7B3M4_ENGPU|nr:hypothetical protein GDO81_013553 [Engystomops pustulosus]